MDQCGVGVGTVDQCGVGVGTVDQCGVGVGTVDQCGVGVGIVHQCGAVGVGSLPALLIRAGHFPEKKKYNNDNNLKMKTMN